MACPLDEQEYVLGKSTFGAVRSVERAFVILQAVNQHRGLRASQVAGITGIPRPSVYRLLETLEGLGLVLRGPSDEAWRPTRHTKSLSSGFREEDWVLQLAVPEMMKLGRELRWPLDLVTFHDYQMEIRESTHSISPFSVDHGMLGRKLPMMETAGGRAYLAFLPDDERDHIIASAKERDDLGAVLNHPDGPLDQIVRRTRELGVGYRIKGFRSRTMSISAPILVHDRPVACLTMIWIASAMKFQDALDTHREPLLASARRIAAAVAGDPAKMSS